MARLLLQQLARTLLATWLLASAVFLLSRANQELAIRQALPETTDMSAAAPTPGQLLASQAALRHRLGLDLPLFYVGHRPASAGAAPGPWRWYGRRNQYHRWLGALLRGDLGTSFRTGQPVAARLGRALAFTLPLTGMAALLATLAALGLAVQLAANPSWQRLARPVLVAVHALPLFVVALALLLLLANPDFLAWFPAYAGAPAAGYFRPEALPGLVLPVAALVLAALPELTLQLEASLAHELRQPYVVTARAKGLSIGAVVRRHALRNALLPTLTQLAALLPAMVAGAVVVETVFALPGMGRLLAEAATNHDYPVLVGGVLLVGTTRLLALLLADFSYSQADPRIRWQR